MADWDVGCELDTARRLAALSTLRAEIDRLKEIIAHLGRRLEEKDRKIGRLRARAAEVIAAWSREDDSVTDAIEVLSRSLNE